MNIVSKAREYAIKSHSETNHFYGENNDPYEVHLVMAVDVGYQFIHLIPMEDRDTVIASIWVHDLIDDCRQTYNDVKNATNEPVAKIAYAVTNEKGKNRQERANPKYYTGIRTTKYATYDKLCDRIANLRFSFKNEKSSKIGMFKKYAQENPKFIHQLTKPEWYQVWNYLLRIFMSKDDFLQHRINKNPYGEMIIYLNNIFRNTYL